MLLVLNKQLFNKLPSFLWQFSTTKRVPLLQEVLVSRHSPRKLQDSLISFHNQFLICFPFMLKQGFVVDQTYQNAFHLHIPLIMELIFVRKVLYKGSN